MQAMASYVLSLHSQVLGAIIREIDGCFNMMTNRGQRSNSTLVYSQAMTSYQLFSHSETLGAMLKEI